MLFTEEEVIYMIRLYSAIDESKQEYDTAQDAAKRRECAVILLEDIQKCRNGVPFKIRNVLSFPDPDFGTLEEICKKELAQQAQAATSSQR